MHLVTREIYRPKCNLGEVDVMEEVKLALVVCESCQVVVYKWGEKLLYHDH